MGRFMANNGNQINSDGLVNAYNQDYKDLGNEMLEVLRIYDKLTIESILDRI